MEYKCLTYVMLNGVKKNPGDVITEEDLANAGQTDDDIGRLVVSRAISSDLDADLHPDHQPLPAPRNMSGALGVSDSDDAEGVTPSA